MAQTGTDGSSSLVVYCIIAIFSVLLLLPLTPFMHRLKHHIPVFLLFIFLGTLLYSLLAFPFSSSNRFKAYFQQTVDLDIGANNVTLTGIEPYIRSIIADIPSAAGQSIICVPDTIRTGLTACSFNGIAPNVVPDIPTGVPPERTYDDWLFYNTSRVPGKNSARFHVRGANTRSCVLRFARPISDFSVVGAHKDDRFEAVPEGGSDQIKLWHREWDQEWVVDVDWPVGDGKKPGEEGMEGTVVCLWSDGNRVGDIPALDEVRMFMPTWSAVSKLSDGLVEGSKRFVTG